MRRFFISAMFLLEAAAISPIMEADEGRVGLGSLIDFAVFNPAMFVIRNYVLEP